MRARPLLALVLGVAAPVLAILALRSIDPLAVAPALAVAHALAAWIAGRHALRAHAVALVLLALGVIGLAIAHDASMPPYVECSISATALAVIALPCAGGPFAIVTTGIVLVVGRVTARLRLRAWSRIAAARRIDRARRRAGPYR